MTNEQAPSLLILVTMRTFIPHSVPFRSSQRMKLSIC